MSIILGIESSCDETAAAVCIDGKICSNIIATQTIHQQYGGVIPEAASRLHQQNIVPVVHEALKQAKVRKNDVDVIAYTQGPGLLGALLVGASFAKGLALALNKPLIGINHMQAHIMAHFIDEPKPAFPFLCLTVSGGHTQIVQVNSYFDMQVLGQTTDDAAGEAFDKAAKILGLPYPGGPLIDKYAKLGNPHAFAFPQTNMPALDFSFSGLKTSFLNLVTKQCQQNPDFITANLHDLAASIQQAIIASLINKLKQAIQQTAITQIAIAGGVSANSGLRAAIQQLATEQALEVFIPKFEYCTDNAAMIAIAGHYHHLHHKYSTQSDSSYAKNRL